MCALSQPAPCPDSQAYTPLPFCSRAAINANGDRSDTISVQQIMGAPLPPTFGTLSATPGVLTIEWSADPINAELGAQYQGTITSKATGQIEGSLPLVTHPQTVGTAGSGYLQAGEKTITVRATNPETSKYGGAPTVTADVTIPFCSATPAIDQATSEWKSYSPKIVLTIGAMQPADRSTPMLSWFRVQVRPGVCGTKRSKANNACGQAQAAMRQAQHACLVCVHAWPHGIPPRGIPTADARCWNWRQHTRNHGCSSLV